MAKSHGKMQTKAHFGGRIVYFMMIYKEHTSINISSGNTCLLWSGNWKDSIREGDLPHLFSFAKNKHITVLEAWNKNNEELYDLFNRPLLVTAHEIPHSAGRT
jgi:hypothetical protein